MKKFDKWMPGSGTIANRMPHIIENWLTTQTRKNRPGSITGDLHNMSICCLLFKGFFPEGGANLSFYWSEVG